MAKEEVLIDVKIDEGESIQSINSLRAAVKEMTKARNEANLQTAEGRATVQSLNQAIDANNAKIKSNIDALNKQRMNVGNYKKDIQEAIPALDQFSGGAASAGQGILTMTKQALAFIATPIGAILAAVAAVVGLLTAALKRSEPALDFFEDVIGSITEAARFLVDNLAAIASVLGNVLTGNMAGAAATTGKLAQEFKNAQREAQRLREEFRELEDEEAKLIATTAGTEAQIKALIIQSKNRNLTEKERIELLKQAEELEKTSTEKKVAYENRKSAATIQQIGNERDLRQAQGETIDAYVQRLIASEKLSGEEKKQVAEAYAARVNASTATLALQEKIQNAQDAAFLKQEEREKARSDAEKKRIEEKIKYENEAALSEAKRQEALDIATQKENERLIAALDNSSELVELNKWLNDERAASDAAYEESKVKQFDAEQKRKQQEVASEAQKQNLLKQLAFAGIGLGQQLFAKNKGISSALAGLSTYLTAQKAYESQFLPIPDFTSPIRGGIAAGIAIVQGLGNIASINGIQAFANSGIVKSGFGLPIQRSNGDNVLATVKTGEVILNQRHQAALGGASTFKAIGVPGFANSGVVGFPNSTITSDSTSLFDLTRLEQSIANLRVQVAVTDINDGQKNYAEIIDRAQF
jgi:hypothetical protein